MSQAFPGICFHLNSSFNLSFVPSVQPQTVDRPGLARRRPVRRPVNIGAFLQNLENKSLTSALPGKVGISSFSFREKLLLYDRQEALLTQGCSTCDEVRDTILSLARHVEISVFLTKYLPGTLVY